MCRHLAGDERQDADTRATLDPAPPQTLKD
jgi:hypothetical protein